MKSIWLVLAAAGVLASAQGVEAAGGGAAQGYPLMHRLDRVMGQIQDDRGEGRLTQRQADTLKNQFQTILAVERRYAATGGIDAWERQDLNRMLDDLEARIRKAREQGQSGPA